MDKNDTIVAVTGILAILLAIVVVAVGISKSTAEENECIKTAYAGCLADSPAASPEECAKVGRKLCVAYDSRYVN